MYNEFEITVIAAQIKKHMDKQCDALMRQYGLRMVELDILRFIAHSDSKDTAKDIISSMRVSKAHVSKAVENLKEKGFIISKSDNNDHRKVHIRITDGAKKVLEEYEIIRREFLSCVFNEISSDEIVTARNVLEKMVDNLNVIMGSD